MNTNAARMALLGLIAVAALGATSTNHSTRTFLRVNKAEFKAHVDDLRKNNIDIAGVDLQKNLVYLLVNDKERAYVKSLGLSIGANNEVRVFDESPDSKYKTPDQIAASLHAMATAHPDLASVVSAGKSLEGRDILALKITTASATAKPSVLFNGMHHAREVMSAEVPLDIAETLLNGYGQDAQITHWLQAYEIYVLPMLNPDGNNKVWTEDNMWRKNARAPYGVDINRNYPYAWNSCGGASDSEGAEDYRGPSAGSEPETHALMDFVTAIHPTFSISFHSFSEVVLYPYGCGDHVETKEVVEPIGKAIAALIPTDDDASTSYSAGTPQELLYSVDGDDIDWMYHEQSVIPYVIEVNSGSQGFQPSYEDWRDKTVAKIRPAWQYLLQRMDGASVRGHVANATAATRVHVQGKGAAASFVQDSNVGPTGVFDLILNPGDYDLTFTTAGTASTRYVHVGETPTSLNVTL